ncbi:YebC/PmpR family DNA-binding transcriptional regulator [candidate division WWE3 bacterium]|uniref:YebC/PmpR family DNA-binding transcriptional regulator n=1 Tax=candidate division WWE3 bacterium TaxID=2053526 RepID=A0A955LH32_UNCKA|nr:YebC/PmpR family DNA-binding transcriptional regulator [candidate division WWE3 bacterium]
MAGHSHWAQIKRKKEATDVKKGKIFTKYSKLITHAAREGGGDPNFNPTLADAIRRAKSENVPKETIEKAIGKGTGELEGVHFETRVYEGYGPAGEAYLIEVLTDSINRTVAELRFILSKNEGSLATSGSAAYIFGDNPEEPSFMIPIEDAKTAEKVLKLYDELEEHDDIQQIYSNSEVSESLLAQINS